MKDIPGFVDRSQQAGPLNRRQLSAEDAIANKTGVAVILAIGDQHSVAVNPDDGRVVLAKDIDTSNCLAYTPLSDLAGGGGPMPLDRIVVTQNYTGPTEQQPGQRRLLQQSTGQPANESVYTLLDNALEAATRDDPYLDLYKACSDQATVVVTRFSTIKLLVKISSLVTAIPLNNITVVNGRLLQPPTDLSCAIPPCPYTEGAWSIFEVLYRLN